MDTKFPFLSHSHQSIVDIYIHIIYTYISHRGPEKNPPQKKTEIPHYTPQEPESLFFFFFLFSSSFFPHTAAGAADGEKGEYIGTWEVRSGGFRRVGWE